MNAILTGKVLWSYDYEVLQRDPSNDVVLPFIGWYVFHRHTGKITLTDYQLTITGDEDLNVPLTNITQLYLGFDEIFPSTLVKNFGLFWQPLRITLQSGLKLYLVIDYNIIFGPNNKHWFNTLTKMFSE